MPYNRRRYTKPRKNCTKCGSPSEPEAVRKSKEYGIGPLCRACLTAYQIEQKETKRKARVQMIKETLASRRCAWCGGPIPWKESYVAKYPNHLPVTCCKLCHGKYSKRNTMYKKDELENRIVEFIRSKGEYTSYKEVMQGLHICHKGLKRNRISIAMLNKRAMGMQEIRVHTRIARTREPRTLEELCQIVQYSATCYADLIRHVVTTARARTSADTSKLLDDIICSYIAEQGHYVGIVAVMAELGISHDCLRSHYQIDVKRINYELGYVDKRQSWFEDEADKLLRNMFGDTRVSREHTFEDCRSVKNWMLRFDFYIATKRLLVEVDGTQHNDSTNNFYREENAINDAIKDAYAFAHNLRLLRVPTEPRRTFCERFNSAVLDVLKPVELLEPRPDNAEGDQQPSLEDYEHWDVQPNLGF